MTQDDRTQNPKPASSRAAKGRGRGRAGASRANTPTMADVARAAGVSLTTVSLVMNNRQGTGLREETQERVRAAIRELGYVPNQQARSLALRDARTVGFIGEGLATSFSGRTLSAAHDHARKEGHGLLIIDVESMDEVGDAVSELQSRQVDGIIVNCDGTREVPRYPWKSRVPVVFVNSVDLSGQYPGLLPDDETAGQIATQTLLDHGHRHIAYLAGDRAGLATTERVAGFRRAVRKARLAASQTPIRYGNFRSDSGYELTHEIMKSRVRPSALFLGNDRMALGCYFALAELGLRVPDDVSVLGFDDQEQLADSLRPALTTMRLPLYDLGRIASEHIISRTTDDLPQVTRFPCPLVPRQSVAAIPVEARVRRARVARAATPA